MSRLQERILDALAEGALTPRDLYRKFATDPAAAVDAAVRGLVRDEAIALVGEAYSRVVPGEDEVPAAEHIVMEGDTVTSVAKVDGGIVVGGIIAPGDAIETWGGGGCAVQKDGFGAGASATSTTVVMRKCRRCQTPKPLTDFPLKTPAGPARLTTCQACWDYEARRALEARAAKAAAPLPGLSPRGPVAGRITPDVVCRLIERQERLAKALQGACDEVQRIRQELHDVEAVVRVATGRERGA